MNFEKMFSTIDTHVEGEAFRIVIQSPIALNEGDIHSNNQLLQVSFQDEKAFLLNEPRGHLNMHGCIVTSSKIADFGLLFFNHNRNVHFKYGGLVTSVTALLETGNLKLKENDIYKIETIQGVYEVKANFENQEVTDVYLESNTCRITEINREYQLVEVDESRNYYVFPLPESIPNIDLDRLSSISKWGKETAKKFMKENISFDGIIITEVINAATNDIRSVTFEKDGNITRSPGIDSTFAVFTALLNTSNEHTHLINYSIFNSSVTASLLPGSTNRYSVKVRGFTTGIHQFIYDQTDPLKNGFLLK